MNNYLCELHKTKLLIIENLKFLKLEELRAVKMIKKKAKTVRVKLNIKLSLTISESDKRLIRHQLKLHDSSELNDIAAVVNINKYSRKNLINYMDFVEGLEKEVRKRYVEGNLLASNISNCYCNLM